MGKKIRTPRRSGKRVLSRQEILNFFSAPDYHPMKFDELAKALNISGKDHTLLTKRIRYLLRNGVIVELKHKGYALSQSADLVVGKIHFFRSGSAVVKNANSGKEIFLPQSQTGTACSGTIISWVMLARKGST